MLAFARLGDGWVDENLLSFPFWLRNQAMCTGYLGAQVSDHFEEFMSRWKMMIIVVCRQGGRKSRIECMTMSLFQCISAAIWNQLLSEMSQVLC